MPTGRNVHGFDPFRIPSAFAVADGARQAELVLATHMMAGQPLPETVALVLWGTDNLKSEGGPIAQAMALMGALPRFDSFGRLCGAALMPLEELDRPRIDVMMTLSGIFRDLAAAANPHAGGSRLSLRPPPTSPMTRISSASMHSRTWPNTTAISRQRRSGCSPTPMAPMAPTSTT